MEVVLYGGTRVGGSFLPGTRMVQFPVTRGRQLLLLPGAGSGFKMQEQKLCRFCLDEKSGKGVLLGGVHEFVLLGRIMALLPG